MNYMVGLGSKSLTYKIAFLIGALSSVTHIILWFIFAIANPARGPIQIETLFVTFVLMVLPAGIVLISLWFNRATLVLIAFLWSLPMGYYFTLAEGIFRWFGIVSIFYLATYILMSNHPKDKP